MTTKNQKSSGGYTIVETVIVMVVSLGIFASVAGVITYQNRRTQFTESVQTFQLRLQDILNDVETGFYPTVNNIRCVPGDPVTITQVSTPQGTNSGCVFVGKVIQFNGSDFEGYTLAGNREADSLDEANPRAVTFVKDVGSLSAQVDVVKAVAKARPSESLSGFGIISSFGPGSGSASGVGTRTSLATLRSGALNTGNGQIDLTNNDVNYASQGITLCLSDGDRKATIVVGGINDQDPVVTIDPSDSEWSSEGCG